MAVDAWRKTGGRFDPTIGPSMVAAGYDRPFEQLTGRHAVTHRSAVPHRSAVTHRPAVPHRPAGRADGIEFDESLRAVTLPPGTELDFGGIAKGVAADVIAEQLIEAGATGCCVNIGGDLRTAGTPPRPDGWYVAIERPHGPPIPVAVAAGAVCTTSKAKRRWAAEHHLRDAATGAPLETGLVSVTVIGARAAQAEVLCKAAFAAGPSEGREIIADHNATGLLVTDEGDTIEVTGFDRFRADGRSPVGVEV
jgi:thiamine biosynthesis lipoprotein